MRRKRGRDWEYNNPAAAVENGRRPQSPTRAAQEKKTCVVAMGLAPECSVLDLKSRFEFYGPVSRIRIDPDSVGYITFRSNDSAAAAVAASRDPDSAITIHSRAVRLSTYSSSSDPSWDSIELSVGLTMCWRFR
ncbi:hypothetical protein MLD38_027365 [Melastoma candidum]|uniref:Uncharacterized protein n=1 Tax=Melastoma candidum TaxID=119954 RepID=A0ACB9P2W4_9MYRT|nr:hypothetical protein MLD38_027365 [Melastoma candidum]